MTVCCRSRADFVSTPPGYRQWAAKLEMDSLFSGRFPVDARFPALARPRMRRLGLGYQHQLQPGSGPHVDVGTTVVGRLFRCQFPLLFATPAFLPVLRAPIALATDPLQALHGNSARARDCGRARCDWVDRVHRALLGGRPRALSVYRHSRRLATQCARQQLLFAALDLDDHQAAPHEHRGGPCDHVADAARH
jgi:hypothetical protein